MEKPVLQKPPGYRNPEPPVKRPLPRKLNLPASQYRKESRSSWMRTCCCFLCLFIAMSCIFLVAAGGIFYIFFEPRVPILHLKYLQIPRFKIATDSGATLLDAQTLISVEVKNPNSRLSMIYRRTQVYINTNNDLDLGSSSFPGFIQGKKNTTTLKLTTVVRNELIDDEVGKQLRSGFNSKSLAVTVEIRMVVGMKMGRWSTATLGVRAICETTLKQIDSGYIPTCTIKLLDLISLL